MHTNARQGGFTLMELLIVVAIIGIIAAIVLPVVFAARGRAQQSTCLSNIRQISAALTLYTQDYDNTYPPVMDDGDNKWDVVVFPYVRSRNVFHCPACPVPPWLDQDGFVIYTKGYALNSQVYDTTDNQQAPVAEKAMPFPASTVTLCEVAFRTGPQPRAASSSIAQDNPDDGSGLRPGESLVGPPGGRRHQGGSNYAFVDGHAKWYKPEQVRGATAGPNDGEHPSFAL